MVDLCSRRMYSLACDSARCKSVATSAHVKSSRHVQRDMLSTHKFERCSPENLNGLCCQSSTETSHSGPHERRRASSCLPQDAVLTHRPWPHTILRIQAWMKPQYKAAVHMCWLLCGDQETDQELLKVQHSPTFELCKLVFFHGIRVVCICEMMLFVFESE